MDLRESQIIMRPPRRSFSSVKQLKAHCLSNLRKEETVPFLHTAEFRKFTLQLFLKPAYRKFWICCRENDWLHCHFFLQYMQDKDVPVWVSVVVAIFRCVWGRGVFFLFYFGKGIQQHPLWNTRFNTISSQTPSPWPSRLKKLTGLGI